MTTAPVCADGAKAGGVVTTRYSSPTALRFGAQGSWPFEGAENPARSVKNGVDLGIAVVS
jgi:hypothetical protein